MILIIILKDTMRGQLRKINDVITYTVTLS